jgi:dephospho-CoA kinase
VIVLGLTGSIGMGKSLAATMLRRMGVPVHDADRAVHALLAAGGGAVDSVARAFPTTRAGRTIDRRKLAAIVFADPGALDRLEAILHPRVRASERDFLKRQRRRRAALVVLESPLLFETGARRRVDRVIVVSAPAWLQRRRVLGRPGASPAAFEAALARQLPDAVKRRRAAYVVAAALGRAYTWRLLCAILAAERRRRCAR